MTEVNKVDLGSIKIHKKVIADIIQSAIVEIDGVELVKSDIISMFTDLMKIPYFPGIGINVDKNNQVTVEVRIVVRYGKNIHDVARLTQDAVRGALERTIDLDLKDVNVNIQGIERGEK